MLIKFCGNIPSDKVADVVAMVDVIPESRVAVMALTLKSPNTPLLAASRSIKSTSLSLTVERNFRARSTTILPHLRRKRENTISTNPSGDQTERELLYFIYFQKVESQTIRNIQTNEVDLFSFSSPQPVRFLWLLALAERGVVLHFITIS